MSLAIIRAVSIGLFGGFGNAMFQYAYAKAYARDRNAVLEVPDDWNGREVFDLNDPPLAYCEAEFMPYGYYQKQEFLKLYTAEYCRQIMPIKKKWFEKYPKPLPFYIAAHSRAGDFQDDLANRTVISKKSTLQAIIKEGYDPDDILWISDEHPKREEHFRKRNKFHVTTGTGFMRDFMWLVQADVIFRANSTFSFWAALLNGKKVFSPDIKEPGLCDCEYVEGNHTRFIWDENDIVLGGE